MNYNLVLVVSFFQNILGAPPSITGFDDLSWILSTLYTIGFMIGIGIFLLVIILQMMGIDVLGLLRSKVGI